MNWVRLQSLLTQNSHICSDSLIVQLNSAMSVCWCRDTLHLQGIDDTRFKIIQKCSNHSSAENYAPGTQFTKGIDKVFRIRAHGMKLFIVRCNLTNLNRICLFCKKAFLYTSKTIGLFFVGFVYCFLHIFYHIEYLWLLSSTAKGLCSWVLHLV